MTNPGPEAPENHVAVGLITLSAALNEIVDELNASGSIDGPRLREKLLAIEGANQEGIARAIIGYIAQPLRDV